MGEASLWLGLIAGPDLTQLDTCAEGGSQIAHQSTKIDTLVSREIEGDSAAIERVFRFYQFHRQIVLTDTLGTANQRILLLILEGEHHAQIVFACQVQHRLERIAQIRFRYLFRSDYHPPCFDAAY